MMGPMPRITESIVANALPLPKRGAVIGGKKVKEVRVQNTDRDYYTVGITMEKGVKRRDVQAALSELLNAHVLNTQMGDLAVRTTHFEMIPTRKGPTVYVVMRVVPLIYNNPGKVKSKMTAAEDFEEHYGEKFSAKNPKKWFRQFPLKNPHGPAHRDHLWKFVGWVGESYGYCDKHNIYHRRASTIMPKIKITKAIDGADTFYHTHPSKDEPSLSSPDDYMLYFDLSFEPRNIRHFYTIMKDRIDYFKIVPKKGGKANYVRIDQDKFLEEVDAKIDELMDKHADDFPDDKQGGLEFCEKVTKETVKWLNKKYGSYVRITYNCFYRVRQNPPVEDYTSLHLGDSMIAKAIADVKSADYSWPTTDINDKPQEKYAYWFGQYYFMDDDPQKQVGLLASSKELQQLPIAQIRDRSRKVGFVPGRLRGINHYLDQKVRGDFSNYDMMNLMNLHIDIMRLDSDITDGGGVKTRIEEMAAQLDLPDEVRDDLLMIEEARILGAHTPEAKTLSGDYYMVLLLVDLCQRAVEVMDEVRAGTKTLEYAKYEVYSKLKEGTISRLDDEITAYMNEFNRGKKSMRLNPPPFLKRGEYEAFIPPEYLQVGGIVTEALEQFAPYEQGKPFITAKSKVNMRVPANGTLVSVQISSLNTGNLQINVPAKGHPLPADPDAAALEAYQKIVNRLNEYGLNIPTEEQEVGSVTVSNPRKNTQVILIAGPSGSGKSTTIRNLLKSLPRSKTVPTYTDRPKRKSDRGGERVFVSKAKFKQMITQNEFAEHALQKNGFHYGRRLEDFKADADYIIVDATLSGVNRLKRLFPNAYTVYLEPIESAEMIRKRLLRRGDITPQEARGRASKIPSHIRSSKMMDFNKRIVTRQGQFDSIALDIMSDIPKSNPGIPFRVPESARPEMERRLTEMMMQPGYEPGTIRDAIEEGIYDDQPSNFSYAQGEYEEFLEEIEKGDMDEAFAEYSDVEGHVAYWLYTNEGIEVPIYNTIHLDKTRKRVEVFGDIFAQFGLEMDSKYLKGGSNFQKTTKVRLALETAAKDQGKSFNATNEEIRDAIAKAVPDVVMENPFGRFRKKGLEKYSTRLSADERLGQRTDLEFLRQRLDLMNQVDALPPNERAKLLYPKSIDTLRIVGQKPVVRVVEPEMFEEGDQLSAEELEQINYEIQNKKFLGGEGEGGAFSPLRRVAKFDYGPVDAREEFEEKRRLFGGYTETTTTTPRRQLMRTGVEVTKKDDYMSALFSKYKFTDRIIKKMVQRHIQRKDNAQSLFFKDSYIGEFSDSTIQLAEERIKSFLDLVERLYDMKEVDITSKIFASSVGEYRKMRENIAGYDDEGNKLPVLTIDVEYPPATQMLLDLYDSIELSHVQQVTDHEFVHKADAASYLMGTDFGDYVYDEEKGKEVLVPPEYDFENPIIDEYGYKGKAPGSAPTLLSGFDQEYYGKEGYENITRLMESSPQMAESSFQYTTTNAYYIEPEVYLGVSTMALKQTKKKFEEYYFISKNGQKEYIEIYEELGRRDPERQREFIDTIYGDRMIGGTYWPTRRVLFFHLISARDNQDAIKKLKIRIQETMAAKNRTPPIFVNPRKKPVSVRIEESPNKEKKMVAYFFDDEGKKVKTTHFGARGMSDYTQHKDPKRMKRYLARHGKMGEDWKDPTTAGALSRWILWGKPSLRESFNDYKKRFRLKGVMTVTNTRMNPKPKALGIIVGGPPHSGKSVFIDKLKNKLRGKGTELFALAPDGEGSWSQKSNQEAAQFIRKKGGFTKEFMDTGIENAQRLMQTQRIVLIDIGGVRSPENERILKETGAQHMIVVAREDPQPERAGREDWEKFAEDNGLNVLASFDTSLEGEERHGMKVNTLRGRLVGLDRGSKQEHEPINALAKLIQTMAPKVGDKGEEGYTVINPVEVKKAASGENWTEEGMKDAIDRVIRLIKRSDKPILFDGPAANWFIASAVVNGSRFNEINIRDFKVEGTIVKPEVKQLSNEELDPNFEYKTKSLPTHTILTVTPINYLIEDVSKALEEMIPPELDKSKGVIISGKLPIVVAAQLALTYAKHHDSVAMLAPPLGEISGYRLPAIEIKLKNFGNFIGLPLKNSKRIPKKYEGQDPSEHSDLFTDEDPKNTIKGLGFKDKETAERSINIIKRSGKTHAHKMQAAMAMEQRARFHAHQTPGIRAGQKVYAKFIKEMKKKTKEMRKNPSRTPEGRKIPKKYLKGLNKEEMAIAAKEIDKGYKYDTDDPEAYEEWKSDIKAKARGYKTVPSKYKKKFIQMYGPLPEKGKFLDKMAKATKIKKSILKKVYDKGLAAWATGHRVGVAPHQWATGRVYSFVTLGNTVKKGNKKMPDYSLAVEAGLVKKNPNEAPGNRVFNEPLSEALEVAEGYMESIGKTYKTTVPIKRINEPLMRRMAKAYDATPNGYDDPKTIKSYEAFIKETNAQFLAIRAAGYDVEVDNDDPYRSSQHMIDDLRNNKRLKIFSAEAGFGSKPITDEQRKKNVLLRQTKHKDINGKTLLVEEMFRFTHDFFGHALKGNGFGPIGEENAWSSHSMMYSPLARLAMTTETRAQFAWTFYSGANRQTEKTRRLANTLRREGKLDEAEKLRKEIQGKFLYPDQKMILLPKEFIENKYPIQVKENPKKPSMDDFFPGNTKVAPYYMTAQRIPITALQNPHWRHGKMMNPEDDPFSDMFAE